MKSLRPVPVKRAGKQDREKKILLGLVEYYIQTGKPVGSNSLKEAGFGELSSATIRNYFANLDEAGFLTQSHTSGGRIPAAPAFRTYADHYLHGDNYKLEENPFRHLLQFDSREIALFLQEAAESLSKTSRCAVFLSAPRFDHDVIVDIKLVALDIYRCLCILVTDFGVIQTEVLRLPEKLSSFALKRIESYFHWRLTGIDLPENLEPDEEALGQSFYNELMLRYIVGYSNFIDEEIYRTGFSNLLTYPDFQDTKLLAGSLALFENVHGMRLLLKECLALDKLKVWIESDLDTFTTDSNCSVLAVPYYINRKPVGAVGIMGPMRLPYRALFVALKLFSECVSETLTRNIYKFKISYRQPETGNLYLQKGDKRFIGQSCPILLEDKRNEKD